MIDAVAQMGPAFLGSRLKRLGERMQASSATIIADADLPLQPGHMAALASLRTGPRTIGQLAEASGTSQPGMTRTIGQLKKLGVVEDAQGEDQRSRVVTLTALGSDMANQIARDIWPRIGVAAEEILASVDCEFLDKLSRIEAALADASIAQRASRAQPGRLSLREYDPSLAREFHDINAEWIEEMFVFEDADREVIEDPQGKVLDPGGAILFVEAAGFGIVGTCALRKTGPGAFERTKMGVRQSARGLKAGEFLLVQAIERAKQLEANKLYLLTNHKCQAAIHLYEKLGFEHDEGIMRDYAARYDRCDIAMLYKGG